ncbi:MAG: ATP-dependent helicase [Saprospiraceae bacterium]
MNTTSTDKSYLKQLNEVQRNAVTQTDGPVLVVAGPGSGKTRVLTFRIAHLIQTGVKPWEILSLTFTNKAAREMKERIGKVVGGRSANFVWAGTFHSIFARILRVEAEKIGYPSNFTIYDTDDSKSLINTIIREMNLDKQTYNTNAIRSRISSAKSNLITPKAYKDNLDLMQQDRIAKRPHLHRIYEQYTIRCKRAGAMDFDDLLYRLFELLQKNPDGVLDKYREKFKYVLVDEFQDTNYLQYRIVKKLVEYPNSQRNICVVGDDAQSIYAFRGATIQNILDFEADFKPHGIQVFKLEQNYRSTEHIVQAANEVIGYNTKQIQKKIWSDKGTGNRIKVIKANTDKEEGKRVADTIIEYKNRLHLSNSDIAILYRTNSQSRVFEEYLRSYNLQYRVYGGMSFYQRKEVKDFLAYLRLAVNVKDEEALRRAINYPKRGIGKTTIDKISTLAAQTGTTMWENLTKVKVSARAKNSINGFIAMVTMFQTKSQTKNAYEVATFVAKKSGLVDLLKADTTIEGMGRLENLNALLDGINEFVEDDTVVEGVAVDTDKSLSTYIQNIALLTDADNEAEVTDYITLMSVHSAKGLEFPAVFVVGLEEKLFPSFMSMDTAEGLDEERRLFYVAITRAEKILTLSYAKSRYKFGSFRYNEPSRFLDEIAPIHLESTAHKRVTSRETPTYGSARVTGLAKKRTDASSKTLRADPKTFKPSPSSKIEEGQKVLHLKFGKGRVQSIDGSGANKIATIHFNEIDNPERKIMLRFAKLQIL